MGPILATVTRSQPSLNIPLLNARVGLRRPVTRTRSQAPPDVTDFLRTEGNAFHFGSWPSSSSMPSGAPPSGTQLRPYFMEFLDQQPPSMPGTYDPRDSLVHPPPVGQSGEMRCWLCGARRTSLNRFGGCVFGCENTALDTGADSGAGPTDTAIRSVPRYFAMSGPRYRIMGDTVVRMWRYGEVAPIEREM